MSTNKGVEIALEEATALCWWQFYCLVLVSIAELLYDSERSHREGGEHQGLSASLLSLSQSKL